MFVEHYRCYLKLLISVMCIRPHPFGCVRIHMDSPADCFFRKEDEGFELRYFEIYGVFGTFMFTKRWIYFNYPIISNCSFCTIPLKGILKGKNKGNHFA